MPPNCGVEKSPGNNRGPTESGICSMLTIYSKLNLHLFVLPRKWFQSQFQAESLNALYFRGLLKDPPHKNQRKPVKNGRSAFSSYQMILYQGEEPKQKQSFKLNSLLLEVLPSSLSAMYVLSCPSRGVGGYKADGPKVSVDLFHQKPSWKRVLLVGG